MCIHIHMHNYIYMCRCTCMVYTYTQMHASTYVHVQRGQMSPENLAFRIPGRRHSASGRLLFAAGCAAARGSAWQLLLRDGNVVNDGYMMIIHARKCSIHCVVGY
jgi:hypothetical protein